MGSTELAGVEADGVTGIDRSRVTLVNSRDATTGDVSCFTAFYDAGTSAGIVARGFVERELGRPLDVFAAEYDVGTLSLPSATVEPSLTPPAPDGLDPEVYAQAIQFSPGGLVFIDPAVVVSQTPAEAYEILPNQMGLAQLVGSGDLEARGESFRPEFYIARPIARFPAALGGAHAVTFILGRGVPMPAGDPAHSCVISEETGLPLVDEIFCSHS